MKYTCPLCGATIITHVPVASVTCSNPVHLGRKPTPMSGAPVGRVA